MINENSLEEVS